MKAVIYAMQPSGLGLSGYWVDVDGFLVDTDDADEVLTGWLMNHTRDEVDPYGGIRWGAKVRDGDRIVSEVWRDEPEWEADEAE